MNKIENEPLVIAICKAVIDNKLQMFSFMAGNEKGKTEFKYKKTYSQFLKEAKNENKSE